MKISKAAPVTLAIITSACGVTCTTLGHYWEVWLFTYFIAVVFGIVAGAVVALAQEP